MKAIYNGDTIAESDKTIVVEGNHYFPPDSVSAKLVPSETPYTCPWKGKAQYWHVKVGDEMYNDGAWSYPEPSEAAKQIAKYIAFSSDVEVTE